MAELQKKREFFKNKLAAAGTVRNGNTVYSDPECNTYELITCM